MALSSSLSRCGMLTLSCRSVEDAGVECGIDISSGMVTGC